MQLGQGAVVCDEGAAVWGKGVVLTFENIGWGETVEGRIIYGLVLEVFGGSRKSGFKVGARGWREWGRVKERNGIHD